MAPPDHARVPLTFVPPGREVRVVEFGAGLDPGQREQLAAYGLAESRSLVVLQQQPVTVIQVEHVEIALEHTVARQLWVERE